MKDKKIGKERMSLAKKVGCSRLLPKDSFLDVFFFFVCVCVNRLLHQKRI